jgi:MFS family permease
LNKTTSHTLSEKLWTFPFINTLILGMWNFFSNSLTTVTLPVLVIALHGTDGQAGLLLTLFSFSALLFRPIAGYLLDHIGRKPVLFIGTIIVMVVCGIYYFNIPLSLLFFLRIVQGAGFSLQFTAAATITSDILPEKKRSEGMGYSGVVNSFINTAAPALGLWIIGTFSFQVLFLLAVVLCVLSLITGALFRSTDLRRVGRISVENGARFQIQLKGLFEKSCLPVSYVLFFIAFANSAIIVFIPLYASARGITNASGFFWVYALVTLVSRPFVDIFIKKTAIERVILPGNLILMVGFTILALAQHISLFLVAGGVLGLGFGAVMPALNAILLNVSPKEKLGAANATFFVTMDLGIGIGAAVWGIIAGATNYSVVYFSCIACIVFGCLAYWFFMRRQIARFMHD